MQSRIQALLTIFQWACPKYLNCRFVVTSTQRSCSQQAQLASDHPGSSADASYHLNGQAFDGLVQPYNEEKQAALGAIAEYFGFRWGGRFRTRDVVHFDDGNYNRPGRC